MSNDEVKRYVPHTYHGGDVVAPSMEENEHGAWVKHGDHERIVAEKDAAYNKLDDINIALNEKIATQKRVIEKLKEQREFLIDVSDSSKDFRRIRRADFNAEIEAIEKGEA